MASRRRPAEVQLRTSLFQDRRSLDQLQRYAEIEVRRFQRRVELRIAQRRFAASGGPPR